MPAPTDLENLGYGRGYLRPGPAASVRRMDVALGRPLDINSAYRDYDEQMRAYLAYRLYQRGLGPWAPLALHPDESWHCKGMAIDTDDRLGQTFLDNGWRFEVATEPWHGQYYTSLDKNYGKPAGSGGGSIPLPGKDDDMAQADVDHIKAQLDAALTVLGNLQNAIGLDANTGINKNAANAAAWSGNANTIASNIRNIINDPTAGVQKKLDQIKAKLGA